MITWFCFFSSSSFHFTELPYCFQSIYVQKKPDYISQHHIESKEYERFVFILWILSIYSSEKKTLDPLTNNSSRWIEYIYTRTEGFKFHQEFNLLCFFLVKHTERERDHSKQLCCFPLFIFSGNLIFVVDLLIHTHTHRKTCYLQLWRWWWWFFLGGMKYTYTPMMILISMCRVCIMETWNPSEKNCVDITEADDDHDFFWIFMANLKKIESRMSIPCLFCRFIYLHWLMIRW